MTANLDINAISELLESKIVLFAEYEKVTDEMLDCQIEEMLDRVGARQNLAHKIDAVDGQLTQIFSADTENKIKEVVLNKIEWDECPSELQGIYLLGQKLFAYFTRIAGKEAQTIAYVETQKEKLLQLIKEQNTGVAGRAVKYYGKVKQSDNNFTLFDSKY